MTDFEKAEYSLLFTDSEKVFSNEFDNLFLKEIHYDTIDLTLLN